VAGTQAPEQLPERQLNELLRRADWRFLLRLTEAPWIADMTSGRDSSAIALVAAAGEPPPGEADVAATGFPSRLALRSALDAARPGGEVVCLWRVPRLFGAGRAAARLRKAGLTDVRVIWPGPVPQRPPQFWLSLDSPEASAHLLAQRRARSALQKALQLLWRACARAGLLAPLCAIGRIPGGEKEPADDEIDAAFPAAAGQLLLTGGHRSINKAVGLPFARGEGEPVAVVKFARVVAADEALAREAATLRLVERDRPGATRVPRLLAEGRRVGRYALAESAIHGEPLIAALTPANHEQLATRVGDWLVDLAGGGESRPREDWWPRLIGKPLEQFEHNFGAVIATDSLVELRRQLEQIGMLPEACEHRDCSPWNIVLDASGAPGLLDWESAEPHGLPGLDLAYFLTNCAFVLDDALETGRTRESYAGQLDPNSPHGAIAARCAARYCARVGVSIEDYDRLRLLCWVIHSASDHQHLSMAAAGAPSPEALRGSSFLGLLETELERLGTS
jgi:hypothetical protein